MGDEEEFEPLDAGERKDIEGDLEDLDAMRGVFQPQGMRGVIIACTECGSDHFYDWELLQENLRHMLQAGEPRMHEPAFEPREEDYVLWDYGKGYVDALADAGLDEDARRVELTECAWCEEPIEPRDAFCGRCGRSVAPMRMLHELQGRGIPEREARALLVKAGFEPFPG
ncbi:MAG TPA: DUF5319 family protein [Actinomycetota bacterium]